MSSQINASLLVALVLSLVAIDPASAQQTPASPVRVQAPVAPPTSAGKVLQTVQPSRAAAAPATAKAARLAHKVRHVGILRALAAGRSGALAVVFAPAGLRDSLAQAFNATGDQFACSQPGTGRSLRGPAVDGAEAFGQTWSLGSVDEDGQVR